METKDRRTKALDDLIINTEDKSIAELVKDLANKLVISKGNKARSDIISAIKPHVTESSFKSCFKKYKQRSFKIIVSSLKIIKGIKPGVFDDMFQAEEYYGRYLGDSPNQAAKKAFTQIFRKCKHSLNDNIEIEFTLKESTNESDKKEYSYRGIASCQVRYMIVRRDQNGKRKVDYTSDETEIKAEIENGKMIYKRNEGEEIFKIPFKTKVISLKNAIK